MFTAQTLIFIFCLIGCGVHSWHLGNQQGISAAINELEKQGIISFDDKDEPD